MPKQSLYILDRTGKKLHVLKWTPDSDQVRGVVHIVHGLAEHSGRYHHVANFLNQNGFVVYAHDHRGHGKTGEDHLGHIDADNGFDLMVSGIADIQTEIQNNFTNLPVFIIGHSMGSFLLQRYLQITEKEPNGVIYSGSNGKPPPILGIGILIAKIISKIYGADAKSSLLHKMTFGAYNSHFKPAKTELDWLSRDPEMVQFYIDDPLCNAVPSASFFGSIFKGLKSVHSHEPFSDHSKDLPILIISGDNDPVSDMGKGIKSLEKLIRKSGITNLTVKLYEGGRHEMFNEINRDEVLNDLLNWLNNHTSS